MLYGVDVVVIDPATVATPIWDKSEDFDAVYPGDPFSPGNKRMFDVMVDRRPQGSPPEHIGRLVARVRERERPRPGT